MTMVVWSHIHLTSSTDFIQITTGFQKTAKLLLAKGFKKNTDIVGWNVAKKIIDH